MVAGRLYKPEIDNSKCCVCGICIRGCPAEIIPEYRNESASLRGRVYQESYKGIAAAPLLNIEKSFNLPPCQEICPIHQDVGGYIRLISENKYGQALDLIRETNALPSVTGYVCTHPCERECTRCGVDEPVAIRALKRFVADFDKGQSTPPKTNPGKGETVSIIGSGPAGLAAAYDLVREGYKVNIIEALPEPGGMLRWAIPSFRLPRDILDRDIKYIQKMGVTIKTGVKFGFEVTLSSLRKSGTDAVIIAIGTQQGLKMGIENEGDIKGYMDSLTLLRKYASSEQVILGDKVAVVGGGNAAVDAARVAVRCGSKEVTIYYRRGYEEMPADKGELREGEAEGVKVNYLTAPVRVIGKNGQVQGLELIRTRLGKPDESGRSKPVPVKGSEFIASTTSIISAVGERPDLSWNQDSLPLRLSPAGTLLVDDDCLTGIEGVFAAGDAVNGSTVIVEAMASGKRAAQAVEAYLSRKAKK